MILIVNNIIIFNLIEEELNNLEIHHLFLVNYNRQNFCRKEATKIKNLQTNILK